MTDNHTPSRRDFLASSMLGAAGAFTYPHFAMGAPKPGGEKVEDIGTRRELFVDRVLIGQLSGDAQQRLHHPVPQEISLKHDAPWEGTGSGYHSVFQDGGLYRMYYKAWHLEVSGGGLSTNRHPLYCCYAESKDGIHWEKPELGLHAFEGSKKNNIVLASGPLGPLEVDAGHPAVFKDENPQAGADARYKAIVRSNKPNGLLPFKSPDGIHWSPMTDAPILHGQGAFDSQNLAFWDPNIGQYRAYWRYFTAGVVSEEEWKPAGHRAIRTAASADLIHWGPTTDLTYEDSPSEQLYTNQIKPYHRAPHLLIGLPARYVDRGWAESTKALPELANREARAKGSQRYGTAMTESLLMASRDGHHFKRWNEAFLPPGVERPGTWHYGQQYLAWHLVETQSALPGAPNELSLYAVESYWHGPGSHLRRYTLRLDGFVSVYAPMRGGELTTKPIVFSGKSLHLNFASSATGQIRVEFQTPAGVPIDGFTLADCHDLFGDAIDRPVLWKSGADVSRLSGQAVRLRFALNDAHLYAYQFQD